MKSLDRLNVQTSFSDRLAESLNELRWNLHDLADRTGYDYNRLQNWYSGRNLPAAPELIALSLALGRSVDWLIAVDQFGHQPLPEPRASLRVPPDNDEYWTESLKFVEAAETSLWMQCRVMPTVGRLNTILGKLLKKEKGSVRIIVSDPDDACTMEMLARRNYRYAHTPEAVADNIRSSIASFSVIDNVRGQFLHRPEIVKLAFMPSTVLYLADPDSEDGKIFAVTTNFGAEPSLSPYVIIEKRLHKPAFDAYLEQFRLMWKQSKPHKWE